MKRLFYILGLVLSFNAYATIMTASGNDCGDNCTWALYDDGLLEISGNGMMNDYEWMTSNNTFDGYQSTAPWGNYSTQISSIKINSGITSIGNHSFRDLSGLTSVILPETLISIGASSFAHTIN